MKFGLDKAVSSYKIMKYKMAIKISFYEAEVRIARCIGLGSLTAGFGD